MNPPSQNTVFPFPRPNLPFSPRLLVTVPVTIFLLIGVFSAYYTVPPESVVVVQRFGKVIETALPGLHFKLPFGIDTTTAVPIRRQLKLEFGFASTGSTNPDQIGTEPDKERDMVTGDLNAANVEWIVQYHIANPVEYMGGGFFSVKMLE